MPTKHTGIHNVSKRDWPRLTWKYPRIHNYEFGFGLSAESTNQASTMVPYFFQNNALVDYENIKTNPENADFAVVAYGDTLAGSYIPNIQVHWVMFIPPSDTEITHLRVDTLPVALSMLNRLDAFDKKTNNDIETILELAHDTGDEITKVLFNGTKLFESGGTYDYAPAGGFADIGLSTDGQPEGIAFDKEMFFDAMHYYTNKEMLKLVTGRMRGYTISEPIVPHGKSIVTGSMSFVPSLCKFQHPYTFCGEIFSVPQVGSRSQYHLAGETTAIEHCQVKGFVRFNEFNPDMNFARA